MALPKAVSCAMTIYNNVDKENGKWVFTQLDGVMWDNSKARNVNTSGIANADALNLIIPFDVTVIEGKEYKEPKEWKSKPENSWTIQTGDIIVKGFVDDVILKHSDLEKKYDEVYVVNTIDAKIFGSKNMWHWEVGAN